MTKIICISDTHTFENFVVPDGDILIHSGDISFRGTFAEMNRGMRWLGKFPHKYKIFVCGNHDWLGETDPLLMKELAEENGVIYLDDSGIELMGLKIWGSPVQPEFCSWAFNRKRGEEIARHWAKIPDDTQILVTHGPPYGIMDECGDMNDRSKMVHVGCEELLKAVQHIKPKLHVFGHIHEGHGQVTVDGTTFVNAAIMDGIYKPINAPITIELK